VIADQLHFLRRHLGASDADQASVATEEPAAATAD
jgi:hypothetical protein